jgi:isoleucyl-tRNA synthetase
MINLDLSDVEISSKDIEGWLVANEGAITVALDVTISEELRKEGIARELINRIQNARKDSGLEVTDRIKLTVLNFGDLQEAINDNKEYIMSETLTDELVFVDQLIDGLDIEFDTIKSKILIYKM